MIIKGNIIKFPRSSRITNQNFDMTYQPYLSILLIIFKICYYLLLTKPTKRVFFGLYFLFISTYQLLPHEMSHMKCFDEVSDLRCRIKCLINACPTQYCEFCSWIRLFPLAFLINV